LNDIERILSFSIEVEKLKAVFRKTRPVGLDRYENSAEHSWHVALLALMLKDHANEPVDIDKVIRMLLIHDLGEIDAGDTIVYQSETAALKAEEQCGVERLLEILPDGYQDEYIGLWLEFEKGESAESKYARAIDRIPPLLHNLHGEGHGWKENDISKEMVLTLNARIGLGSAEVWKVILSQLEEAIEIGILK
jgi:putative hydrolase of HD superfamily